jgi:hypothetical protein
MTLKYLCAFLLVLGATVCLSQPEPARSGTTPGVDVFGGYVFGAGNSSQTGNGFLAGVDIARLFKKMGLTAEFDLTKASSPPSSSNAIYESNVLVGPKFLVPLSNASRVQVFVDALIGTDTFHNAGQLYTWGFNNRTTVAWAFDGGLEVPLNHHLALRGQAGYLGTTLVGSTDGNPGTGPTTVSSRARIGVAAVYRF